MLNNDYMKSFSSVLLEIRGNKKTGLGLGQKKRKKRKIFNLSRKKSKLLVEKIFLSVFVFK
jgi:hypothetical protein